MFAQRRTKHTCTQTIAVQRLPPIATPPGMSDTTWATTMTAALWAFRRLGLK